MKSTQEVGKSKFSLGGAMSSIVSVKSGERVSNETVPYVTTASQLNKFTINKPAAELMGLVSERRVKLLITGLPVAEGRYLLAISTDEDSTAAKVANPSGADGYGSLLFNYAGIWSKMVQYDVEDAKEKSIEAFEAEGVAVKRSNTGYINRKVAYKVVEVEDINEENPLTDPFTSVVYTKVFALVEPKMESVELSKEVKTRKVKEVVAETSKEVE